MNGIDLFHPLLINNERMGCISICITGICLDWIAKCNSMVRITIFSNDILPNDIVGDCFVRVIHPSKFLLYTSVSDNNKIFRENEKGNKTFQTTTHVQYRMSITIVLEILYIFFVEWLSSRFLDKRVQHNHQIID